MKILRSFISIVRNRFEFIVWTTGLIFLFFLDTENPQSLCLSRLIGLGMCPGCGLGHAIHYALHGKFSLSINEHFLGIPAVVIILYRIKQLSFTPEPNSTL